MYSGSLAARWERSCSALRQFSCIRYRICDCIVGNQTLVARRILARNHHRFAHSRVLRQLGLDLSQLDTETTDLDLKVVAS